jgi:hypothetical protein
MKIIREKRNTGCYSPPSLKEISPEITKEGKHKNMMKGALVVEIRECPNS